MKILIITILPIIAFLSCENEKEFILSKHDNGEIHELLILENPITKDSIGTKFMFFETGELQCKGGYKSGLRHGKWICYNRSREIEWEATYIKGKENGEIYCQYSNGTWKRLRTINGKREGKTVEYNLDSTTNEFYYVYGQYENDLETGLWVWQDTVEQIMKEINYEEGVNIGHFAFYYPNGNIKMKGQGFRKDEDEYIRMKDTLYFYNEMDSGEIDSMEIYEKGRLKQTINK